MNWLDITLLCLAGIGFVNHQTGCFAYSPSDRDLFLRESGGLAERIYLGVGLVSGRRGYDLELYSGFYLDYGGIYPSG